MGPGRAVSDPPTIPVCERPRISQLCGETDLSMQTQAGSKKVR